ncbi:MAG: acyl-CoA thioesterase [Rhodothermia bacterium]|nr:acyl-CoA thioesterase [Rhodothermia bacterium]
MIVFEYRHRVRYRECDPMGIVYHTHYLDYFEAARTEALRSMGLAYKELEASGVIMPVTEAAIRYHKPARYDDVITIQTMLDPEVPETRLRINYLGWVGQRSMKVVSGHVTLCFFDPRRERPIRAPAAIKHVFSAAIERLDDLTGVSA